jgi:predicted thioredoxin/glutaredoxin
MPNPKGNPSTLAKYSPKWKSGETRTIRVPIVLAETILEYAHQIDDETVTQVIQGRNDKAIAVASQDQDAKLKETLTQVIQVLESVCETPRTSKFTNILKARIQTEAIERLKTLTQVNQEVE